MPPSRHESTVHLLHCLCTQRIQYRATCTYMAYVYTHTASGTYIVARAGFLTCPVDADVSLLLRSSELLHSQSLQSRSAQGKAEEASPPRLTLTSVTFFYKNKLLHIGRVLKKGFRGQCLRYISGTGRGRFQRRSRRQTHLAQYSNMPSKTGAVRLSHRSQVEAPHLQPGTRPGCQASRCAGSPHTLHPCNALHSVLSAGMSWRKVIHQGQYSALAVWRQAV